MLGNNLYTVAEVNQFQTDLDEVKSIETAIKILSGKWKIRILLALLQEKKRYNEMRRLLPNVTQRVLTKQLREMEEAGLINRTIYAEIPPKVVYSITEYGRTLKPLLIMLSQWGNRKINQ